MKLSSTFTIVTPLSKALAFFFLVFFTAFGFYMGVVYQIHIQTRETFEKITSEKETPNIDKAAKWKTYTNEEYWFEFKYPDDWNVSAVTEEVTDNFVLSIQPTIVKETDPTTDSIISLHIYTSSSIDDYLNSIWCPQNENCAEIATNTTLDNIPAKSNQSYGDKRFPLRRVATYHQGRVYAINVFNADFQQQITNAEFDEEAIFDQILSSFRFLGDGEKVIDSKSVCESKGGMWLEQYQECEQINEQDCSTLNGTFNACTSPCRHQKGIVKCIQLCVSVCSF